MKRKIGLFFFLVILSYGIVAQDTNIEMQDFSFQLKNVVVTLWGDGEKVSRLLGTPDSKEYYPKGVSENDANTVTLKYGKTMISFFKYGNYIEYVSSSDTDLLIRGIAPIGMDMQQFINESKLPFVKYDSQNYGLDLAVPIEEAGGWFMLWITAEDNVIVSAKMQTGYE